MKLFTCPLHITPVLLLLKIWHLHFLAKDGAPWIVAAPALTKLFKSLKSDRGHPYSTSTTPIFYS